MPLYINVDKSPKVARMEQQTKKLGQLCSQLYPSKQFRAIKCAGSVRMDNVPIVQLALGKFDEDTALQWHPEVDSMGLNKDNIRKAFLNACGRPEARLQWTCG